jgi:hypothetical protein
MSAAIAGLSVPIAMLSAAVARLRILSGAFAGCQTFCDLFEVVNVCAFSGGVGSRWCGLPQPPATFWQPSGLVTQHASLGRKLESSQTNLLEVSA